MIILKQNINKMQNYAIWIQIALSIILKLKIFIKTLQVMLKKDLIDQNCEIDRLLPKGKNKKTDWMNEISIRWKDYDRVYRT